MRACNISRVYWLSTKEFLLTNISAFVHATKHSITSLNRQTQLLDLYWLIFGLMHKCISLYFEYFFQNNSEPLWRQRRPDWSVYGSDWSSLAERRGRFDTTGFLLYFCEYRKYSVQSLVWSQRECMCVCTCVRACVRACVCVCVCCGSGGYCLLFRWCNRML